VAENPRSTDEASAVGTNEKEKTFERAKIHERGGSAEAKVKVTEQAKVTEKSMSHGKQKLEGFQHANVTAQAKRK